MPTTVISVRGRDRAALLADKSFVYVGRPVYHPTVNWHGSIWGNPFRIGMKRHAAIRILGHDIDWELRANTVDARLCRIFHRKWLQEVSGLTGRLHELCGKVLGCWCCDWRPGMPVVKYCHAITLAGFADRMDGGLELVGWASQPELF